MSWIPLAYIFNTSIIEVILNNFVVPSSTRIEAIKCFTEIASIDFKDLSPSEQRGIQEKVCMYFCLFI